MRVAFQGELGSNSHELCRDAFPDAEPHPCATFDDAFAAVRSGTCEIGLLAMENSTAGRVTDVHALLPRSGLKIVGERFKRVRFQLMGNPGTSLDDIRVVRSHAMALAQCRRLLTELGARGEAALDTAGAARELAHHPDPRQGVLAPRLAAELFGLTILKEDVEDEAHNTTRFIVLTADPRPAEPPEDAPCLTSLVFKTRDVPAALYKALGSFASNGINLWKLESYVGGAGEFRAASFYAEIDGRPSEPHVAAAMEELAFFSREYAILGVFAADPSRRAGASRKPNPMQPGEAPQADEAGWPESLTRLRHSIDNIDAAVIHLLAERFKATRQIGQLKVAKGLAASDPAREAQQLSRLQRLAQGAELHEGFADKFLKFVIAEVIQHHTAAKG